MDGTPDATPFVRPVSFIICTTNCKWDSNQRACKVIAKFPSKLREFSSGRDMDECKNIALVGIGNPLLDISTEVSDEFLDKYGLKSNDAILAEEKHMPLYNELVDSYPVQYVAGGATQNSIRVAQWMLREPGFTGFLGAIGSDNFGDRLRSCAKGDGVETHYYVDPDTPTGTCAVLLNSTNRSLVANLAAANKFEPSHLETEKASAMLCSARLYYIAGFFLTVSLEAILKVAKTAVEERKVLAMNLSAPFVVQFFGEQLATALAYCDYVFGNETEAEAFGEKHGWGSDVSTVALKLAALPKASGTRARVVVFTQGAGSTIVASEGNVHVYPVDALTKDELVDTNGAGDAFVGGFLSQVMKGQDLKKCVDAGHWAARVVIQRSGCSFPSTCDYE